MAADIPNLFTHTPSPAESFIRKVMFGVQELERDQIIHWLTAGLAAKHATSARLTQVGKVKVNGCHSILEKKKLKRAGMARIKKLAKERKLARMGLRPLAAAMGKILGKSIHHETARRIMNEIGNKKL